MELQSCFHFLPALSWYRRIALADRHVAWMQQVKMYHCFGLHAMGFVPHNGEGRPAGQCETETGPVTVSHLPYPDPFLPGLRHARPGLDRIAGQASQYKRCTKPETGTEDCWNCTTNPRIFWGFVVYLQQKLLDLIGFNGQCVT